MSSRQYFVVWAARFRSGYRLINWSDRYDQLVQLTVWQVDNREDALVDGGHDIDLAASAHLGQWRPFLRAGFAEDAGVFLDRSISIGFGYDSRGGKETLCLGVGWGRAPAFSSSKPTLAESTKNRSDQAII